MLTIRAMADGKGYSSRHLEHSDYYAEGERVVGEWHGRGAELLGLSGPVDTGDFEALRQGHNPGTTEFLRVAEALRETEACAASRVRQGGANEDRTTANMVLAVYHHDTSRELDPQLHTHAVAANLTFDGAEGRWKALQASGIYERRAYLSEVYRNVLAHEVRTIGYEIESQP